MTHDEMLAVIAAHRDGKKVECAFMGSGDFDLTREPLWDFSKFIYRIAPEPKLRPWKPEEVPVGAWYRKPTQPEVWAQLAGLNSNKTGHCTLSIGCGWLQPLSELEHSTDGGKTWKPCGVEEDV